MVVRQIFSGLTGRREPHAEDIAFIVFRNSLEQFPADDVECQLFPSNQARGVVSKDVASESGSTSGIAGSAQHERDIRALRFHRPAMFVRQGASNPRVSPTAIRFPIISGRAMIDLAEVAPEAHPNS